MKKKNYRAPEAVVVRVVLETAVAGDVIVSGDQMPVALNDWEASEIAVGSVDGTGAEGGVVAFPWF
jgi:predicted RecA/RadA family phage recombinase